MNNMIALLKSRHRWKASDFLPWVEAAETIPFLKTVLNNNLIKSLKLRSSNLFLRQAQHLLIKINDSRSHLTILVVSEKMMVSLLSATRERAVYSIPSQSLKDLQTLSTNLTTEVLTK